jgi:hypothetical protein
MHLPLQSISSVAERPHWTVANGQATFAPVHGSWRATVRRLHRPTGGDRYHVAIIDRRGAVRFTMETAGLDDAVRNAERGVLARNALRLVPRVGLG